MIIDSIKNMENYRSIPLVYRALQEIKKLGDSFPESRVVFDGDTLFLNPIKLTTKPKDDCVFEAHQNYLDLHYIVEGAEGIAFCEVSRLTAASPYNQEKDITFYEGGEEGICFLKPGYFMVCWPNDAHMVKIMEKEPEDIRKFVVKIKASEV